LPHQLENFRFTRSRLLIGLFRRLEASALRTSDAVITICPDLADYARERMPDTDRHFLIENSILDEVKLVGDELPDGADRGRSAVPALPENARLVVYAGTLEPYQGIELLLQAFTGVRRREPRAFLLVVGGSSAQVEHFRELANELGLQGQYHFTGRLSQERAREHSRRADVLVSPRIDGTNTPLKIYEQLASGIPLVATDIPAHSQILSPEVAFLASPEPEPFSDALVAALTRDDERSRRVEAARRLYQERYSRAVYRERLAQMLNALR
jgi:glycosyltransferase involved in cell wall biosynthesis